MSEDFRAMPFVTVEQVLRMRDAACQELDRLRAEVASLKEERDKLQAAYTKVLFQYEDMKPQLAAAKEYAERLREALECYKDAQRPDECIGGGYYTITDDGDIARSALALPKPWDKTDV